MIFLLLVSDCADKELWRAVCFFLFLLGDREVRHHAMMICYRWTHGRRSVDTLNNTAGASPVAAPKDTSCPVHGHHAPLLTLLPNVMLVVHQEKLAVAIIIGD